MKLVVEKTEKLEGEVVIPSSKSHTVRAVIIASLAEGTSKIMNPLKSDDTMAAVNACKALGAKINTENEKENIRGNYRFMRPRSRITEFFQNSAGRKLRYTFYRYGCTYS